MNGNHDILITMLNMLEDHWVTAFFAGKYDVVNDIDYKITDLIETCMCRDDPPVMYADNIADGATKKTDYMEVLELARVEAIESGKYDLAHSIHEIMQKIEKYKKGEKADGV